MEQLQFISQETEHLSHLDSIRAACKAGIKLVQLRIKEKPESDILPFAAEAKTICDEFGCKLIINDYPGIALAVNAYGVHVGKEDMPVNEVRKKVGTQIIIGGTANTFEDIEIHWKAGADYVGLGPFRFTNTKKKLSPVLGLKGYQDIMGQLRKKNIDIPIFAIGGIELNDIKDIIQTGVRGVAVSSLIARSKHAEETARAIYKIIKEPISTGTC